MYGREENETERKEERKKTGRSDTWRRDGTREDADTSMMKRGFTLGWVEWDRTRRSVSGVGQYGADVHV